MEGDSGGLIELLQRHTRVAESRPGRRSDLHQDQQARRLEVIVPVSLWALRSKEAIRCA
jgi:hypothetical protein